MSVTKPDPQGERGVAVVSERAMPVKPRRFELSRKGSE